MPTSCSKLPCGIGSGIGVNGDGYNIQVAVTSRFDDYLAGCSNGYTKLASCIRGTFITKWPMLGRCSQARSSTHLGTVCGSLPMSQIQAQHSRSRQRLVGPQKVDPVELRIEVQKIVSFACGRSSLQGGMDFHGYSSKLVSLKGSLL